MIDYDFFCEHCDLIETIEWPIGETLANPVCRQCGLVMPQKLYPAPTHLKGPGFYKNDKGV